jgi:hypothetical protein
MTNQTNKFRTAHQKRRFRLRSIKFGSYIWGPLLEQAVLFLLPPKPDKIVVRNLTENLSQNDVRLETWNTHGSQKPMHTSFDLLINLLHQFIPHTTSHEEISCGIC